MPRAYYTDHPWADVEVERSILSKADCHVEVATNNREETIAAEVGDAETIITCWAPVTARVIDSAPRCRHIARTGIGLDNIDVAHATKRGITVTNVPDYCVEEVAEHALAMIFALGRKIAAGHLATKQGHYNLVDLQPIERITGKTLGIVGLGRTGSLLAQKAAAVGMRILANNRSQKVPSGTQWVPLETLLAQSDYVSLNCPLTDQTNHLMNEATFKLMQPSAYLINTSRGGLIDHESLAKTLDAGLLAGAALDVQETEPPNLEQAPYNDPRVIVTPHTAFCSTEAILDLRTRVGHQVADFLKGKTPENIVNTPA